MSQFLPLAKVVPAIALPFAFFFLLCPREKTLCGKLKANSSIQTFLPNRIVGSAHQS